VERGLVFDRVAEEYERVRPGYPPELVDAALAGAEIRRVLEVGCGTGQLTEALAARGLDVEAVEPGANLAALARRRAPGLRVHAGRFEDVVLAEGAYDAVFSATAFHWVDPAVGWAKVAAVLRPGGRVALLAHVYVSDAEVLPAQRALSDAYGASWAFPAAEEALAAAVSRRNNISEVWAGLAYSAESRDEAAELFGETRLEARPLRYDLDAAAFLALQRTTSTHLTLAPDRVEAVEQAIVDLVAALGGRYPIRQLAVLAVAERR
jgi:SAM-dependent methyltransferase